MLKLTIPEVSNLYSSLVDHKRAARVVALSGGYPRAEACKRLAANRGMIASFSRALVEDLRHSMDDAAFDAAQEKIDRRDLPGLHRECLTRAWPSGGCLSLNTW